MIPGKRGMTGKHGHQKPRPLAARVPVSCEQCGTVRYYREAEIRVRGKIRFCSQKCSGKSRKKPGTKIYVICDFCKQFFKKRADQVKRRQHIYCTKRCSNAARVIPNARWRDPTYVKAYMSQYQKTHRIELNKKSSVWVVANHSKKLSIQQRYRKTHRSFLALSAMARRFGLRAGTFTLDQWEDLKLRYDYRCLGCTRQEPEIVLEPDHVISLKAGGRHDVTNIQPLCRSCNARKGSKIIDFRR